MQFSNGSTITATATATSKPKPKSKPKQQQKANALTGFCACHDFYMYEKWKTTITTTVKAAGEAFAELDTIVVVAYVDCIIVVVSLQLCCCSR